MLGPPQGRRKRHFCCPRGKNKNSTGRPTSEVIAIDRSMDSHGVSTRNDTVGIGVRGIACNEGWTLWGVAPLEMQVQGVGIGRGNEGGGGTGQRGRSFVSPNPSAERVAGAAHAGRSRKGPVPGMSSPPEGPTRAPLLREACDIVRERGLFVLAEALSASSMPSRGYGRYRPSLPLFQAVLSPPSPQSP